MVVYPDGIWYSGVTAKDLPEIVSQHFGSGKVVERLVNKDVAALRTEIDGNKMKMITAMKANDAAGVLPDDLNQRIRGFRESRVILTAIELDVFTAVGKGASSTDVAKRLGSDPRATEMLLNALVALELLEKKEGSFTNSAVSARYLMEGSPDDSRAGLMHSVHLWGRWSTLTDCVREGTSVTRKQGLVRDKNRTESFIAAMHKNATPRAAMVVRTVGTEGIKRMLDVGGGSGAYSIAFAQANPDLHAEVFDLADVTPIAQRHIDQTGISDRVKTRVGDLYTDEFGNGYDLVLISAICHMNSPEENVDMLKKAFGALSSGGRVVIQDFILTPDKTVPVSAALFALNMLVGTRAGSSYSEPEYFDWLKQVGFKDAKLIRMPGPAALIVAKRE
jgi:predicted O-methyltransferase YrrM